MACIVKLIVMIGICGLHDRLVCKAKQVWEGQTGTHRNKPWIRSSNIKYVQIYYCPCFLHESVFQKGDFYSVYLNSGDSYSYPNHPKAVDLRCPCSSCWIILVKAICLATTTGWYGSIFSVFFCLCFISWGAFRHLGILYRNFVGYHLSMGVPELLTPKMAPRKKRASSNHPFGVIIFLDSLRKSTLRS